jgi:hypothetical protein
MEAAYQHRDDMVHAMQRFNLVWKARFDKAKRSGTLLQYMERRSAAEELFYTRWNRPFKRPKGLRPKIIRQVMREFGATKRVVERSWNEYRKAISIWANLDRIKS